MKYMCKSVFRFFVVKLIFLFSFGICELYSQPILTTFTDKNNTNKNTNNTNKKDTVRNKWLDFRLSTDIVSTSMRYDSRSNEILKDTLPIFIDSLGIEHKYPYTTDLSQKRINLHIGYLDIKNLYCYIKFPFIYTVIEENLEYDSTLTIRYPINNDSKFYCPEGSQVDVGYSFNFDFFNITFLGSVFFPFYKYNSNRNSININSDSTDNYIDKYINTKKIELERAFETSIGTKFDFNFKPVRMQLGGMFNQRSEDFTNRLHLNFLVGLTSIEETELFANFRYVTSLGDYAEKYKIDFWHQTLWENYFDVDLGFAIFFTDEFYANLGYTIRLYGENTLSHKTLNINLGYIIQR
jgi:hypothetical protein